MVISGPAQPRLIKRLGRKTLESFQRSIGVLFFLSFQSLTDEMKIVVKSVCNWNEKTKLRTRYLMISGIQADKIKWLKMRNVIKKSYDRDKPSFYIGYVNKDIIKQELFVERIIGKLKFWKKDKLVDILIRLDDNIKYKYSFKRLPMKLMVRNCLIYYSFPLFKINDGDWKPKTLDEYSYKFHRIS